PMRIVSLALFCTLFLVACRHEYADNPDPNHTHADVAVWIEGEKVDFSGDQYMSGLEDDHDHEHDHLHPHLHLHDGIGHVVHQHRPGLTFGEFLESVGFSFEGWEQVCFVDEHQIKKCWPASGGNWRFFVNGKEVMCGPTEDCLHPLFVAKDYVFRDMDGLLLLFNASDTDREAAFREITDDACLYSRTCPWRGDPPAENCIADPTVPCVVP
ncbi:hypothetical protein COW95_04170, partial [Candidatus Peregrinibacteria bacterium CG22_combo_CG10-13_8_21_14_all_49_11]